MGIFQNPPPPFVGGTAPLLPRQLDPGIPGQSVDQPLPCHPGRRATSDTLRASWRPSDWPAVFAGAEQAYQGRQLNPQITAVRVDAPVGTPNDLAPAVLVSWISVAPAPILGRLSPAGLLAVPVNDPPHGNVGRDATTDPLLAAWQPRASSPILPVKLVPASVAIIVQVPLAAVQPWLVAWVPAAPLPTLPIVLNASLTAVEVDAPPKPPRQVVWYWLD